MLPSCPAQVAARASAGESARAVARHDFELEAVGDEVEAEQRERRNRRERVEHEEPSRSAGLAPLVTQGGGELHHAGQRQHERDPHQPQTKIHDEPRCGSRRGEWPAAERLGGNSCPSIPVDRRCCTGAGTVGSAGLARQPGSPAAKVAARREIAREALRAQAAGPGRSVSDCAFAWRRPRSIRDLAVDRSCGASPRWWRSRAWPSTPSSALQSRAWAIRASSRSCSRPTASLIPPATRSTPCWGTAS